MACDLEALLHAAQVAGRAHGQIHFFVYFVDDQGAAVVPALPGDIGDEDLSLFVDQVAVCVAGADDLVFLGDVEISFVKGQAVVFFEAAQGDYALVGDAVLVAVGQGEDFVGTHIGHVQHAIVIEGHEAGLAQAVVGEYAGRKTGGQVEHEVFGDCAAEWLGHFDRDGLQTQIDLGYEGAERVAFLGEGDGGDKAEC